jgi:uncharacterized OB-fold protein
MSNGIPALVLPALARPGVDALTEGYWEAARERRLVVQRCSSCGAHRHPPTAVCYRCHSSEWSWAPLTGLGSVFTFVWVDSSVDPALADTVPYNVCIIELEGTEGDPVRMTTNVVGVTKETLEIGLPVAVDFESVDEGATLLPIFRPRSDT